MTLDAPTLTGELTSFWRDYADWVIAATGLALLALLAFIAVRFGRSAHKARWLDRLASILVLAWTSEGMWEVATASDKLNLPTPFAAVTFFVAEAMIVSAAMDAEAHRRAYGHPGPHGKLVWLLTAGFSLVVFVGADSPVEHAFRLVVPLAAAAKWWTSLTAQWPTDTDAMRDARRERTAAREATWAVTPRTLLVQWGIMKPGEITITDAQREHQIRRMVTLADTIATLTGWRRDRAQRRYRTLSRTLDEAMLTEVRERIDRTERAAQLLGQPMTPGAAAPSRVDTLAAPPPATAPPAPRPLAPVPPARRRPTTAEAAPSAVRPGLPEGVTSTRQLDDAALTQLVAAWVASLETVPTVNALYERYGLRADRAKRVLDGLALTPGMPVDEVTRALLTGPSTPDGPPAERTDSLPRSHQPA